MSGTATPERRRDGLRTRLTVDAGGHRVFVDGVEVPAITPDMFRLLQVLAESPRRRQSKQALSTALWETQWTDATLHSLVSRTRQRLNEAGHDGKSLLVTLNGFGYGLAAAEPEERTDVVAARAVERRSLPAGWGRVLAVAVAVGVVVAAGALIGDGPATSRLSSADAPGDSGRPVTPAATPAVTALVLEKRLPPGVLPEAPPNHAVYVFRVDGLDITGLLRPGMVDSPAGGWGQPPGYADRLVVWVSMTRPSGLIPIVLTLPGGPVITTAFQHEGTTATVAPTPVASSLSTSAASVGVPFIAAVLDPVGDQIVLSRWPIGAEVDAELRSLDGTIVEGWAGIVIGGGDFTVFPLGRDVFEPGQTLTVTLGSLRKQVTLFSLEIAGDVEANAIVGRAPARAVVVIAANCTGPSACAVYQEVRADAEGRFRLDLDGRTTLELGSNVSAGVSDVQGDRVFAQNTAGSADLTALSGR